MADSEKIDLYKQYKDQYAAPKSPVLVTVDRAGYLCISGRGAPGGPEFTDKVGALYGAAYTIKMTRKFASLQDYVICKLEAQWWLDGGRQDFADVPREQWNWKLMIRTPDMVGEDELQRAQSVLTQKGKSPRVSEVKLETIREGLCVQMLHVGPYEQENRTIAVMEDFAAQQGMGFHGLHHEIYLSDPRRVPPERLKTILRHPVIKKDHQSSK